MSTQLELEIAITEPKHAWAFAMPGKGTNRRRLKDLSSYVITSSSREARLMGVRAGMKYEDARAVMPSLKVLCIGSKGRLQSFR